MNTTNIQIIEGSIVENEIHMTITELCHATNVAEEHVMAWVNEGILNPTGHSPDDWRFSGNSLRRALQALRLSRDLEINTPGVAMVLDLLDEITRLQK